MAMNGNDYTMREKCEGPSRILGSEESLVLRSCTCGYVGDGGNEGIQMNAPRYLDS